MKCYKEQSIRNVPRVTSLRYDVGPALLHNDYVFFLLDLATFLPSDVRYVYVHLYCWSNN